MDRRVTLIVFLPFWCLSHQQGLEMTLCRGDMSVRAQCGAGRTPFPGQLPPGWGRTCQAGTTPCPLTTQSTVEWTQHYDQYQCDSETWNLNYLCLPANETVDMCQDVRQTREGNTSLVHGQLMASRSDNVTCTCVVTRSPGQINTGILVRLYTRHLVQPPDAEAASCQGTLTLRDTRRSSLTLCLLTTRLTWQYWSEVSLWPEYFFLNDTTSLTITYELNGGATWGQDQLLPFALRLSGTGSYDVECGRLDDDVTESTGSYVPTTINAVLTNREFESTSTTGPTAITTVHTIRETTSVDNPGNSGAGIIIGLSVALAIVVVLWLLSVGYLLRRSRLTPGKPSHGEDHQNSINMEIQTRTTVANNNVQEPSLSAKNESGVECENDGRDVTMDTSGVYETVRDRDPAIQNRDVHHNEGQGRDGPNTEHIDLSSVTMNQPTRYQSSTELALQDNTLYGSPM